VGAADEWLLAIVEVHLASFGVLGPPRAEGSR
jgi:hypothetical protein